MIFIHRKLARECNDAVFVVLAHFLAAKQVQTASTQGLPGSLTGAVTTLCVAESHPPGAVATGHEERCLLPSQRHGPELLQHLK